MDDKYLYRYTLRTFHSDISSENAWWLITNQPSNKHRTPKLVFCNFQVYSWNQYVNFWPKQTYNSKRIQVCEYDTLEFRNQNICIFCQLIGITWFSKVLQFFLSLLFCISYFVFGLAPLWVFSDEKVLLPVLYRV